MVFGFSRGQGAIELPREGGEDDESRAEGLDGKFIVEIKVSPDIAESVEIPGQLIMVPITVYSVYDKESKQPRRCDRNYQTFLIASEKYLKEIGGDNGSGKIEVNEIDPSENAALERMLSKDGIRVSKALITPEAEQALNSLPESDDEGQPHDKEEMKV